jgi:hypothetical protein
MTVGNETSQAAFRFWLDGMEMVTMDAVSRKSHNSALGRGAVSRKSQNSALGRGAVCLEESEESSRSRYRDL